MLTLGWKELACVALYTTLVYAAHAILRVALPFPRTPIPPPSLPDLRRRLIRGAAAFAVSLVIGLFLAGPLARAIIPPSLAGRFNAPYSSLPILLAVFLSSPAWMNWTAPVFLAGGVLGALFIFPAAVPLTRALTCGNYVEIFWDSTVGAGLILLTAPILYRATSVLTKIDSPARRWPLLTPTLMLTAALATISQAIFNMTLVFLPMCVAAMAGIGVAELAAAHSAGRQLSISRLGSWGIRLSLECLLGAAIALGMLVLAR